MKWCKLQLAKLFVLSIVLLQGLQNVIAGPINPSPDLLRHGQYELSGNLVTNQITSATGQDRQWPFVTGLEFGILDRSTFGVQYGDGVSIQGKTLIFEDEGWVPNMVLGFRHLFHSQEAHFFQIQDDEKKNWENDIYIQFARTLESGTTIQGGINILSSLGDGGASPFWGFDYRASPWLSIDYEGFHRWGATHHNLGVSYVDSTQLGIGVGFFEVQEWFYQEGQLGFYASPETNRPDAFLSPGLYVEIRVRGLMSKINRSTTQLKLKDLEMKQKLLSDSVSHLRKRLARTELLLSEITGPRVVFDEESETEAALTLDKLVQVYRTTPDDVVRLRQLQDSLLALNEPAHNVLLSLADHPATDNVYRETVIKVMGNARLKKFSSSLVSHLNHSQIIIKREALISLGKIADLSTLEEVRKLTTDKDPIVKIIAEQVVDKIIKKAKEIEGQDPSSELTSQAKQSDEKSSEMVDQKSKKVEPEQKVKGSQNLDGKPKDLSSLAPGGKKPPLEDIPKNSKPLTKPKDQVNEALEAP